MYMHALSDPFSLTHITQSSLVCIKGFGAEQKKDTKRIYWIVELEYI